MNCQECQALLDAYSDNELNAANAIRVQQHLLGCCECQEARASLQGLQAVLRELRFQLPPGVRENVTSALARERAAIAARDRKKRVIPLFAPLAMAAAVALMAGLAWFKIGAPYSPARQGKLVAELTARHIRSLLADHLLDVTSSDQHTVKPWFAGKIQYAPPVMDLAAQGFRLAGGRLDYINNRSVATIVYEHNKHVINLFVWPAAVRATSGEATFTKDGYNLVNWVKDGMNFWAVSDVAMEVLRKFCDAAGA